MKKADLTISLLRYRMMCGGRDLGFSVGESALMAEQRLKNAGYFGFFGKMKLPGTPEGAIVCIVETFWRAFVQQTCASPAVVHLDNEPAKQLMLQQFRDNALSAIEGHRKGFFGGSPEYPKELTDYVFYRMETELPQTHGLRPDEMGLDRDVIGHMVDECNSYFRSRIDDLR